MNIVKALELMNKYAKCPECGGDQLGNGYGTLEITDDTFKRTCKCGFVVSVKENQEGI